jgi:hypothetical protein
VSPASRTVVPVVRDERVHDRGAEQDDLHEVLVLAQERLEAGLLLGSRELVRTAGLEPLSRLTRLEAAIGLHA